MEIILQKNHKKLPVFTAEIDMTGITADDVTWSSDDFKAALMSYCDKHKIGVIDITVGHDNNGNATFATVTTTASN